MNNYALIPFMAFVITTFGFSMVFGWRRKEPIARSFLLLTGCFATWIFSELIAYHTQLNHTHRLVIIRLSGLIWMPSGLLFLNFALHLTRRKAHRFWYFWGLFTALSGILYATTSLGVRQMIDAKWGYLPINGPYHTLFTMVPSVPSIRGLSHILSTMRTSVTRRDRSTYLAAFLGGSLSLFICLLLDTILPNLLDIQNVPRFGSSAMAILSIFIYFAMVRFDFLTVTVETFAEEFFQDVKDGLILANEHGLTRRINKAAEKMLGIRLMEASDRPAATLLKIPRLPGHAQEEEIAYSSEEGEKHYSISQYTHTQGNKLLGIVILIRDITERKQLEQSLRTSYYELEERVVQRTQQLDAANQQLMDSRKELQLLTERLSESREAEGARIARELHDELGQLLTAVRLHLGLLRKKLERANYETSIEHARELGDSIALLDTTIKSVKRIARGLRPAMLDNLGLKGTLEWMIDDFGKRAALSCKFHSELDDTELDPSLVTAVYRVAQESLTNIARHANAKQVDIFLGTQNNALVLLVRDDGVGIDVNHLKRRTSLGILGMMERARSIGGELSIERIVEGGTEVALRVNLS